MPGAFLTNDLPFFFAESEFGDRFTWKGTPLNGIFDDADTEVTNDAGETMILAQPMVTTSSVSVIGIAQGDAVVVRGVSYIVSHWIDDGAGMIEIYLSDPA